MIVFLPNSMFELKIPVYTVCFNFFFFCSSSNFALGKVKLSHNSRVA